MMKQAMLYETLNYKKVHCYLCNHHCRIADTEFGFCGVRENRNGDLYTHAYGEAVAAHVDPIEKKPLFHVLPGSTAFSIATAGCNFQCGFCQNWQISQIIYKNHADFAGMQFTRRKKLSGRQKKITAPASPTPIPNPLFFLNMPMIRRNWLKRRDCSIFS